MSKREKRALYLRALVVDTGCVTRDRMLSAERLAMPSQSLLVRLGCISSGVGS